MSNMQTLHSPIPAYLLGTACLGRGAMALFSPHKEYGHVGLPLETSKGHASPLMQFKGIRELSYGAAMVALQWQGHEGALTTIAAILSVVRLGDGIVVWCKGGEELRYRAWGHWVTGMGFAGWVAWRLR
jgi:hypothetical protein